MPYGFSDDEWSAGKTEMVHILRHKATSRGMITYSELAGALKTIEIGYKDPAMDAMLGQITTDEALKAQSYEHGSRVAKPPGASSTLHTGVKSPKQNDCP